jgi:hypothetical protein
MHPLWQPILSPWPRIPPCGSAWALPVWREFRKYLLCGKRWVSWLRCSLPGVRIVTNRLINRTSLIPQPAAPSPSWTLRICPQPSSRNWLSWVATLKSPSTPPARPLHHWHPITYDIALTGTGLPNITPQRVNGIPDQQVRPGTPLAIDVASWFTDPDGHALSYTLVGNTHPGFVSAVLSGAVLQLSGLAVGTTEITLRATDSVGGTVTDTFLVTAVTNFTVGPQAPFLTTPSRLADGSVLLEIATVPGKNYQLETIRDLTEWTAEAGILQAGASTLQWIQRDIPSAGAKRFFRVRQK